MSWRPISSLAHFQHLLCNNRSVFDETLPEASTKDPLASLCFSGRTTRIFYNCITLCNGGDYFAFVLLQFQKMYYRIIFVLFLLYLSMRIVVIIYIYMIAFSLFCISMWHPCPFCIFIHVFVFQPVAMVIIFLFYEYFSM